MTFGEFACKYTAVTRLTEQEQRYVRQLVEEFGDVPLADLRLARLDPWWARILAEGHPSAANKLRSRLRNMLSVAVRWELIQRNPVAQLRKAREAAPRVRWLTPEQRASLLAHANPRLRLYILTAAYTAGRRRSVRYLRERDIDLAVGIVTFRGTKNGDDVTVPLNSVLRAELELRLTGNPDAYVLHPYQSLASIGQAFRRLCRRLGIRDFHYHDLRHDCATALISQGASLRIVQEFLGHRTPAMSARYGHVQPAVLKDFAERLYGAQLATSGPNGTSKPTPEPAAYLG
jgi:integrase